MSASMSESESHADVNKHVVGVVVVVVVKCFSM